MTIVQHDTSEARLERSAMRLNAGALAVAFGVAGALEVAIFVTVTGAMWGVMDGGAGSMHRLTGIGNGPGSMMGGGFGSVFYAVLCGLLGGGLAGAVSAWVYNAAVSRQVRVHP